MKESKTIVIVTTLMVLSLLVIFAGLANVGMISGIEKGSSQLFPETFDRISTKYEIEIRPAPQVNGIWVFIYIYQLAWVIYTVALIFRRGAPDVLSASFYTVFIFSCIFNIVWIFLWSREIFGLGFAVIALTGITLKLTCYFAFNSLSTYLESFPKAEERPSSPDVWCIRLLVINGLAFFSSWVSFETLLSFTTVLEHLLSAKAGAAATTSLTLLVLGVVAWFCVENFAWEEMTRFCFTEYIPLIVGLSGVIKQNWVSGDGNQGYTLFVLIVTVLLLIARLVIIFFKEKNRGLFAFSQQEPVGENVKLV